MPKKRYRPEEIISKLREADVLISQGKYDIGRTSRGAGAPPSSIFRSNDVCAGSAPCCHSVQYLCVSIHGICNPIGCPKIRQSVA
jgi:hypothetical protein